MGCHVAERFQRLPAVDRARAVDLFRLGLRPRIEERVVVADDHLARGVTQLRADELGVAAADEGARDIAAAERERLLGVALAPAHARAVEHALPATVAPVMIAESFFRGYLCPIEFERTHGDSGKSRGSGPAPPQTIGRSSKVQLTRSKSAV
jgi:hypothetical protein